MSKKAGLIDEAVGIAMKFQIDCQENDNITGCRSLS
jgi:hypothetical protein